MTAEEAAMIMMSGGGGSTATTDIIDQIWAFPTRYGGTIGSGSDGFHYYIKMGTPDIVGVAVENNSYISQTSYDFENNRTIDGERIHYIVDYTEPVILWLVMLANTGDSKQDILYAQALNGIYSYSDYGSLFNKYYHYAVLTTNPNDSPPTTTYRSVYLREMTERVLEYITLNVTRKLTSGVTNNINFYVTLRYHDIITRYKDYIVEEDGSWTVAPPLTVDFQQIQKAVNIPLSASLANYQGIPISNPAGFYSLKSNQELLDGYLKLLTAADNSDIPIS